MAWLFKTTENGNYKIGWRIGKKIFTRSTGTKDEAEAKKQLATCHIIVKANAANNLTDSLVKSLKAQPMGRVALKPCINDYLARKTATVSAGTLHAYRSAFNGLLESLNATDEKPALGDITKPVLQKYLAQLRSHCAAVTCNNRVKYFGAFFREMDSIYHTGDPTERLDTFYETAEEADAPDRRPFTVEEMRLIYSVANIFWRFAIKCGYFTAFRLGRIASLQWHHINFQTSAFDVKNTKPQKKKKLPVPILPEMLSELKSLRAMAGDVKPTDYLFPEYAKLFLEKGSYALSREFHNLLVKVGIHKPYGKGKTGKRATNELTFHCLRHNSVTALKAVGAPQMVAQGLAGHASPAVSDAYTHTSSELVRTHLEKVQNPFPD